MEKSVEYITIKTERKTRLSRSLLAERFIEHISFQYNMHAVFKGTFYFSHKLECLDRHFVPILLIWIISEQIELFILLTMVYKCSVVEKYIFTMNIHFQKYFA